MPKKRIADAELLAKEQLAIEKEMLNQGLITQQEYNAREQEINAQRLQVTRDEADRFNAERISNFEAAANKELEIQHYKLQQGLISREEYENSETQLRIEARELRNQIEEEQDNLDRERRAMDEANRKELEMAAAERIGADTTLVQQKYEHAKEKLTKERVNSELTMTAGLAGQMSDLLGEESAAGKAFGVVQATINTYLGATKALAQGGILGIAQAAIVIAFGMKQVMSIAKQKDPDTKVNTSVKKYAKGGTIAGKSHSQGGVKFVGDNGQAFEAEGGENIYILKKTASNEINALSDVNVEHGGKSFRANGAPVKTSGEKFANGGKVNNTYSYRGGDSIVTPKYDKSKTVERVLSLPSVSNFDTTNNTFSETNQKFANGGKVNNTTNNRSSRINQKFANGGKVNNTYSYRGGDSLSNVYMPRYSQGGRVSSVWNTTEYEALNNISNVDVFSAVSNTRNYISSSGLYKFADGGMVSTISEANRLQRQVDSVQLSKESISQLAAVVIEAVSAMPSPIVSVHDIDTAQNEVNVVQSFATY